MWVKNTGAWHIMHSYRVTKGGWAFILTVDGQVFPAGSKDIKFTENPKANNICGNCDRVNYHVKHTVEVDNVSILSSDIQ